MDNICNHQVQSAPLLALVQNNPILFPIQEINGIQIILILETILKKTNHMEYLFVIISYATNNQIVP